MRPLTWCLTLAVVAVLGDSRAAAADGQPPPTQEPKPSSPGPRDRPRLTEVYTPHFEQLDQPASGEHTVTYMMRELTTPRGWRFVTTLVPNQAGVLWVWLLVTFAVGFEWAHPWRGRNIDLIALQLLGLSFFGILWFPSLLHMPPYITLMDWVFDAIVAINLFLLVRAVRRVYRPEATTWRPGLGHRALIAAALVLLLGDSMIALIKSPDDAGFYVNLGAQRLRERGTLPYGDPLLSGSAGAAYAPLLYVAHLPFQVALDPSRVNAKSPDRPVLGDQSTYYLPPELAAKLCTIAFHLFGVAMLWLAARRLLASSHAAWALVVLYCGSPFVLGVGGDDEFIGGMTFVTHIAPPAVTLAAFAALARPTLAGMVLAAATGVGFYPVFMGFGWLGYYWARGQERWRFLAGFFVTLLMIGAGVLILSRPAGGRGLVATILADTLGHHTNPRGYGSSPFSFWGQRGGIRGWFRTPLVGASSLVSPMFLAYLVLVMRSFFMTRNRGARELALVSAAVAIGASVLKIHPTGTYVAWCYPLLLLGLFADGLGAHGIRD